MSKRWVRISEEGVIHQVAYLNEDSPTFLESLFPGEWLEAGNNSTFDPKFLNASEGAAYDKDLEACYYPKPHPSWTLDTAYYDWRAPVDYPDDEGSYSWNEEGQSWDPA